MALVYRARDRERDEPVAAKLLADNLAADPELPHRSTRQPEQAAGEETTGATDVYALGVVLYELLTGERCDREEDQRPPSALAEGVPPELDSLVLACLHEDPKSRPTAREVELVLRGELEAP